MHAEAGVLRVLYGTRGTSGATARLHTEKGARWARPPESPSKLQVECECQIQEERLLRRNPCIGPPAQVRMRDKAEWGEL